VYIDISIYYRTLSTNTAMYCYKFVECAAEWIVFKDVFSSEETFKAFGYLLFNNVANIVHCIIFHKSYDFSMDFKILGTSKFIEINTHTISYPIYWIFFEINKTASRR
jgi:hypothetical protein